MIPGLAGLRHSPAIAIIVTASAALCALLTAIIALGVILGVTQSPDTPASSIGHALGVTIANAPLLVRTLSVTLLIGFISTVLAFPAAWSMRRLRPGWTVLLVAPIFVPNYIVYAGWGLARAPGTWAGDLLLRDAPTWAPFVTKMHAILALALWAWPIAAVVMGAGARTIENVTLDSMRLAPASTWSRARVVLTSMRGAIAISIALVTLIMLSGAVPLHVAQVETYAIVIWRLLDETGGAAGAWIAATPLLMIAIVAACALARLLDRTTRAEARTQCAPDRNIHLFWLIAAWLIWALSTLAPLALFLINIKSAHSFTRVWRLVSEAAGVSAGVALAAGVAGIFVCAAMSLWLATAPRTAAPVCARLTLLFWIALLLTPGVLIGSALLSASTLPGGGWIGETRIGVAGAHIARFCALAAVAGFVFARMEPRSLAEVRDLAGPLSFASWLRTSAPLQAGGMGAIALAIFALSFHEIEASVILAPPGADNLPQRMLSYLHYNRMEELSAACALILAITLGLGFMASLFGSRTLRFMRAAPALLLVITPLVMSSCEAEPSSEAIPIVVSHEIGEVGRAPGQFVYPRAVDARDDRLYVVDKSGRIQTLSAEGAPIGSWPVPDISQGFPVGVTCGSDGLVYIPDTHQQRVIVYKPAQNGSAIQIDSWGSYGDGPGEFYYTTDIAILPGDDGVTPERFYVSEYGGNDRISAFDAEHNFLFSFGSEGASESAERIQFRRPQSILIHPELGELIVADAANHRVGRFSLDGELVRWLGLPGATPGSAPGAFNYPYGLAILPDGTVLVAEFGNNRVQRIDPASGSSLGLYGVAGRDEGELAYPWAIATLGWRAFVVDSGNSRLLAFAPKKNPRPIRASMTTHEEGATLQ